MQLVEEKEKEKKLKQNQNTITKHHNKYFDFI